ncbi:MAG: TIGR03936 family radical SAM-associated protein [Eubacteriaceae bacterium]|nr:TIGR03936 family radical SAM-associated protein [Eubacteriaceae bacterium]
MSRYIIRFAKEGYMKYTSHLDMLRLFQRAFKRCDITMAHSQGFNPHPKMGFAQPLSLGYTAADEILEFETVEDFLPVDIKNAVSEIMPQGLIIKACSRLTDNVKSLAAIVDEAEYTVVFPVKANSADYAKILSDYLTQDSIKAYKRQKKTKKMVEVDIRSKIRNIQLIEGENLTLKLVLDCGSTSNLSPEQVISSLMEFANLGIERYDVEVERTKISFDRKLHI